MTAGPAAAELAAHVHPLELQNVGVRFDDFVALEGISFAVPRGEIAVVIGGSGAGKTTLGRVIVGLLRPTSGAVYVDGEDMAQLPLRARSRVRAKFGMVFQYSALLDSLTVMENVALPLVEHEKSLSRKEVQERVRGMLAALDLPNTEHLLPSELSGGMRKRVGLARALIRRPSIVVYDEPASGLDPVAARRVDDLIRHTRDRFEVTSVVISHDMAQAFGLADHLYVLDKGRLAAAGTPAELSAEEGSLAAQFFAASVLNQGDMSKAIRISPPTPLTMPTTSGPVVGTSLLPDRRR